jgi:aminoglycoside 3-N-acetyltransferase
MEENNISYQELTTALRELDIPKGGILMVHSSMKAFGRPVDGGAEAVLDCLAETVGAGGTLLMPTLTFSSVDESAPVLDVANTPSDCGILTNLLRKQNGAKRSCHIVSSACAWGTNADWLTEYHTDTPCGEQTPYGKVISTGGYVLFLGAGFQSNTLFHAAEEAEDRPYFSYAQIADARIIQPDGTEFTNTFRRYNCSQTGIRRYLQKMEKVFEERGVLRRVQLGDSVLTLIRAKDDYEISREILRDHVDYILNA